MGNLKEKLLSLCEKRTKKVPIDGIDYLVQEVEALDFSEYGRMRRENRQQALAFLFARCVIDENGEAMLSEEEALLVARSARVAMPMLAAIMDVSGFGDDEKEPDAG